MRSDRRLLRRLLQNLVSNAIKYTPSGRVLVGARRRGDRLSIEVWDTGLGIPASKQKIVFREFQRLDQGAKVARGLGLGLSIVERIGRVLDHPIALARSRAAARCSGSRCRSSRRRAGARRCRSRCRARRRRRSPGSRVLAIDNEPAILDGMRTLLTGWGCAVHHRAADRGGARGDRRRRWPPEVIIADYHLDEGNGLEVIARLRRRIAAELPGGSR